jgi:hypothetical protein
MAHFAKLGVGNIVEKIEVISNDIIGTSNDLSVTEKIGSDFLNKLYNTRDVWKQTSYNSNFRKNYADIGMTYDQQRDAFIPTKKFDSWTLNENTCRWEPPIPCPTDGEAYKWDESTLTWIKALKGITSNSTTGS